MLPTEDERPQKPITKLTNTWAQARMSADKNMRENKVDTLKNASMAVSDMCIAKQDLSVACQIFRATDAFPLYVYMV